MFRASMINDRGPDTQFSVDFVLQLPETIVSAAEHNLFNLSSNLSILLPSATTIPSIIAEDATL